MEGSVKTNRLAIISIASGVMALLGQGLILVLGVIFPPPPGHFSPLLGRAGLIILLSALATVLSLPIALVTGILALRQINKKQRIEKGKGLAWAGIALGGGLSSLYVLDLIRGVLKMKGVSF